MSSALEIVSAVFGFAGACSILSAFIPQILNTYRTKNTVGVNRTMFILHFLCGVFFFYGAVLMIVGGFASGETNTLLIANGVIFAILNFICPLGALYVVLLKTQNKEEAAKRGITELEHYHQFCVPYVEEKMLKNK